MLALNNVGRQLRNVDRQIIFTERENWSARLASLGQTMRQNLSTQCLVQELLCCLARAPPRTPVVPPSVLLLVLPRLSPPFVHERLCMYVCISVHRVHTYVHAHTTDLFGHYSRYVALSSSLPRFLNYSQTTAALCSNTPGVPVLSRMHPYTYHTMQRSKLLLSFRGITLVATCILSVHIPRSPSSAR